MNAPSSSAGDFEGIRTPRFKDGGSYLNLSYQELEERNGDILCKRGTEKPHTQKDVVRFLSSKEGQRVRSVMVCFTNAEGRLHHLDFSTDSVINASDNLRFDGSSIDGFSPQGESDLKFALD